MDKSSPINTLYEQLSFIKLHETDKKDVCSIGPKLETLLWQTFIHFNCMKQTKEVLSSIQAKMGSPIHLQNKNSDFLVVEV